MDIFVARPVQGSPLPRSVVYTDVRGIPEESAPRSSTTAVIAWSDFYCHQEQLGGAHNDKGERISFAALSKADPQSASVSMQFV
jgi:hypothetical protein